MSYRSSRDWSPASAAAVCLLFLAAFALGGLWVGPLEVRYELFGLVDGLAGLLILYVLVNTGVLSWPDTLWGGVVLVYAGLAAAQLVALLLPPPGVLQWIVLGVILFYAWNASYGVHRSRIVLSLGLAGVALAALKYSVLPLVWSATELPSTPLIDLRAIGEGFKSFFASYEVARPITQFFAFLSIVAWSLAVWFGWPPAPEDDWISLLPRAERDRLLYLMLTRDPESRPGALDSDAVRGRLARPEEDD